MSAPGIQNALLRPVREDDLEAIYQLASNAPDPITTVPPDRDYLGKRIQSSLRSFHPSITEPGPESYFFVLEDPASGQILGTSAIFARTGGYEPFYSYEIRSSTLTHEPLGVSKTIRELHLKTNHDGPSEISSLFLAPAARRLRLGRLLSFSRFLFMAQFPQRFADQTLTELRGYADDSGRAPFWDAVGTHFFGCDYITADQHSAMASKAFIRDLMPRHPIYTTLLPASARKAIGQVHPNTLPALKLLASQGFQFSGEVDIFDAGPIHTAPTRQIKAVSESQTSPLAKDPLPEPTEDPPALLTNARLDFRASKAPARLLPDATLSILEKTARLLHLKPGDPVRYLLP